MKHFIRAAVLLALSVPGSVALACSPAPGYRVPTNLELAHQANLIMLGEVVGNAPGDPGNSFSAGITVQPIAAIKGLLPNGNVELRGMALAGPDEPELARRSDPRELTEPHPQAFAGACIRRVFPQGARVLFFLERRDGQWAPAGGPFSRWAEDVPDPDAPWFQLATLYAHAAQLGSDERVALLQDQIDALQARPDSETALLMAGDIERQMAGPNEPLRPESLPPAPENAAAAEMAPEIGEFRESDELSAVQRALDAMRANQGN